MFILINKRSAMIAMAAVLTVSLSAAVGGFIVKSTFGYGSGEHLKIVVDAGHGKPDGGAVGKNGSIEEEINLKIALMLEEILSGKGVEVVMTRTDNNGLQTEGATIRSMKVSDMHNRLEIMTNSGAELFVSVHMNAFESEKASGLNVFYAKNSPELAVLADDIQKRISDVTGAKTHSVRAADSRLFLLKKPPVPSILVECGFITNPEEEKKLNDPEYQAKIAWAIAEGIENYYTLYK